MSGVPRGTLVQKLLIALASCLAVLAFLEAAAAVLLNRQDVKNTLAVDRYMDYDPRLGWTKRPGARVSIRTSEYAVDVTINSRGLRGPEREYAKAARTFRVLALGDSFVEGYTVSLPQTVTAVLETDLRAEACAIEGLNGGTAGYSTDQEYLFYEDEGSRYAPDVVVLFFYFNDVLYNQRDHYADGDPKPLLVLNDQKLELAEFPVPRRGSTTSREPPAVTQEPRHGSALLAWVRSRLRSGAPRLYNSLARLGLWAPVLRKHPPEELEVYRTHASDEIRQAWERTGLIIQALRDSVGRHGGRFLVAYVPSRMEVSDRDWRLTQFEYQMSERHFDRGEVLHRLQATLERAQVPLVDLTPALRREDRGILGGPYFTHDGHWNALGHKTAASEIAAFLRRRGWVRCSP